MEVAFVISSLKHSTEPSVEVSEPDVSTLSSVFAEETIFDFLTILRLIIYNSKFHSPLCSILI